MRNLVTSFAEVIGAASVSTGAFLWSIPAGFVVSGAFLLAFARQAVRS
jgi:hypothetical protein